MIFVFENRPKSIFIYYLSKSRINTAIWISIYSIISLNSDLIMRFVNKITREGMQISGGWDNEEVFGYRNVSFGIGRYRVAGLFHVPAHQAVDPAGTDQRGILD